MTGSRLTSPIAEVDRITRDNLAGLVSGETLALRIRSFISRGSAAEIADKLANHWSLSPYRNTPELVRVGESHYETHDADGTTNTEALERYLNRADLLMAEIRSACEPYQSPMDLLWQMLDAECGLERARIRDKEMFAGIVRIFPEGTELLPHNDSLARDAPGEPIAAELVAQLAANIYLRVPDEGGWLQIWNIHPTAEQLAAWHAEESEYGLDRDLMPRPDLELQVEAGELLVFDATKPHSVTRQIQGSRIGLSCFVGVRHGRPLVCWS